ncbi:MAG: phosphoribosylamine--glycine ligase [Candidatus Omnitrophica bacterium]|nr:phosphoribosylamine--glycine ligase [Candidatus Omnitrophota bacterium]
MNILIIGSGGREHCLGWKIKQSPQCGRLYFAPGNGGTSFLGENVDINIKEPKAVANFVLNNHIDFVVIGPEAPLVGGLVDELSKERVLAFGPSRELARLEGSKIYAKELMQSLGIPTAAFKVFNSSVSALKYLRQRKYPAVIKADGLAAGKGVFVVDNYQAAEEAVEEIMVKKKFGSAGERILIEDFLAGREASLLVLTDGETIVPLASSQDHKRAYERDRGPNTGGMGAYSPAPVLEGEIMQRAQDMIFKPLIEGLRKKGAIYRGLLYGGLMIKEGIPYVLEFNVRFGDPETQAVLPRLKSDLLEALVKTAQGHLSEVSLEWDRRACVCVVLASGGYPGNYEKGKEIRGIEAAEEDAFVFHAGTKLDEERSRLLSNGGRVLNVCALAESLAEAKQKAYHAIEKIHFENMFFRRDIADKALKKN